MQKFAINVDSRFVIQTEPEQQAENQILEKQFYKLSDSELRILQAAKMNHGFYYSSDSEWKLLERVKIEPIVQTSV